MSKELDRKFVAAANARERARQDYNCAVAVEEAMRKAWQRALAAVDRAQDRLDAADVVESEAMKAALSDRLKQTLDTPPEKV